MFDILENKLICLPRIRRLRPLSRVCAKHEATTNCWLTKISTNTGNGEKQLGGLCPKVTKSAHQHL